jgi:formate hydrogenlyase subunit 3/multisubunit Na+/H+ antiporter MnhD subunit
VTAVELGLGAQLLLVALAVLGAVLAPEARRGAAAALGSVAVAAAGVITGALALGGGRGFVQIPTSLDLGAVGLGATPLGGFFMIVCGGVGAMAVLFAIGYVGPSGTRTGWAALPLFLGAMQLVPAATDAVSFLLMWELMAVASTTLVLSEHAHRAEVHTEVRSAGLWYAGMTQLSFVLILLGFGVLAASAGSVSFASMAAVDPGTPAASVAFVLLTLGFATKAGIVPLHVWLPRAHPAAPSHVSAVMSAAMVKLGVYGVLLVSLIVLPGGPGWWGLALLALGAVSAVYGILQASVASDLKRLLAYSTTENVGLMFLAMGTGLLLRSVSVPGPADVAIVSCLLLVASHAAFKSTLFLGAGSVMHATGERDLDRMGGLGARMPVTSAAFGIGALGAAALPVTAGFVAEWALLQSLIHGARPDDRLVAVAMPVAVAVVALTAGLALMTFVKAYGIAFLARPRSGGATDAQEATRSMRAAMILAGASVLLLGLVPGLVAEAAARAAGVPGVGSGGWFGLDLPGVEAALDPVALLLIATVIAVPVVWVSVLAARRRPRRRVELAWGGGGVRVSSRMQYTATSYAEPLARVFDDALRPERDIEVTHASESRYLVERVQFHQHLEDVVEVSLYRPLLALVDRCGTAARRLQNGSIHRYLGYSFLALVAVLVLVAL